MILPQLFGLACLGLLFGMPAWAQEQPTQDTCPHPKGWKPTNEELQRILSDHQRWAERWQVRKWEKPSDSEGRANLCNADLVEVDLNKANLFGAKLNKANLLVAKLNQANLSRAELNEALLVGAELNEADLSAAELTKANLQGAKLNKADLSAAKLNQANLSVANLNEANLSEAEMNEAHLGGSQLNNANLTKAKLNKANLSLANLNKANLVDAELNEADLFVANLNEANLGGAKLNKANLSQAKLQEANLRRASVAGTHLDYADLTAAYYAPSSPAPDAYVAQIKGLETIFFPDGEEVGLVQLRDLLQKAGHRDLERQATFAIESGRTNHSIARNNLGDIAEGIFRKVAFDLTTRYGLEPARALFSIAVVWALLIPVYSWPIWRQPRQAKYASGIYRVLPKDRIEVRGGKPTLDDPARVERLHIRGLATIAWSAYFSLLSAFQIGFREFSVGTWLSRAQPRNFALEATGWVRTLSGLQSLLSVYLLAMWLLTYFGRPFQ
jgi:uncharacterized protein YjbI with pentapeptide repeats